MKVRGARSPLVARESRRGRFDQMRRRPGGERRPPLGVAGARPVARAASAPWRQGISGGARSRPLGDGVETAFSPPLSALPVPCPWVRGGSAAAGGGVLGSPGPRVTPPSSSGGTSAAEPGVTPPSSSGGTPNWHWVGTGPPGGSLGVPVLPCSPVLAAVVWEAVWVRHPAKPVQVASGTCSG